ncbi:MAG: inorganic phosphate transporter [Steroidobacteraceae bacterium]
MLLAVASFLGFSNGANDNFKGFATVWGSATLSYGRALALAAVATALGSLASLALSHALVLQFTGKGIVPDAVAADPGFALSAAAGAAATVMLATRLGLPISTTHALIGGLAGAGLAQDGSGIQADRLAATFLLPLLLSPLVAALLAFVAGRSFAARDGDRDCACVAIGEEIEAAGSGAAAMSSAAPARLLIAPVADCDRLAGSVARFRLAPLKDAAHIASAACICFARGVNDTPKLAALLLTTQAFGVRGASLVIAAAMLAGGLLFARRVAQTMSQRIAPLDHSSGLAANLVTAGLVFLASRFGLPVSTTHVSVGSIIGVGLGEGRIDWRTTSVILLSWVGTLPLAAAVAFFAARIGAP